MSLYSIITVKASPMLGQTENNSPSIKKSMTNRKKSSCSFLFQAISMEAHRGNCASVMSTKLLEEFLINLFETELDVLFLLINKL